MLKIPSYPICKTYENAYTFMNLEKSKNRKIQKSKNPKSNYEHQHMPIIPSFIYITILLLLFYKFIFVYDNSPWLPI